MASNLLSINPYLNDPQNDFLTNVNNDQNIVGGPYSLTQLMNYISWIGLEYTQEFQNNIQNNTTELTKKNYVENVSNTLYNSSCP